MMTTTYSGPFIGTPIESSPIRRRDPLGVADIANRFAELLAPGLTGRTTDARWMTILCWCIRQVMDRFGDVDDPQEWYHRLRALELLFVCRASRADNKQPNRRQLPGQRAVKRWLDERGTSLRDKMGRMAWHRYRSAGPYGAYRGLMSESGLLDEEGMTLTDVGERLAKELDWAAKGETHRNNDDAQQGWIQYWIRRFEELDHENEIRRNAAHLPTPWDSPGLSNTERALLRVRLFESGSPEASRRQETAKALEGTNHDHVAQCTALRDRLGSGWNKDDKNWLDQLPWFADLTEAAVTCLRGCYLSQSRQTATIASEPAVKPFLSRARKVADKWGVPEGTDWDVCRTLVTALRKATDDDARLRTLLQHHKDQAGGERWLVLDQRNDTVSRSAGFAKPPAGVYRFRLSALARLAYQCGYQTVGVFMSEYEDEDEE